MAYKITKGKVEKPLLLLIYGPDKVGKSTFAASAPKPIFIQAEEGSNQLDVARLETPKNFREIMEQVAQVATDPEYQTLVIDTLDWMQAMVFEQVCATADKMPKTIADIPFGRGYPMALILWREFIAQLNLVRDSGKNVILLAHSVLKKYEDPTVAGGYDRYQLQLHDGSTTSKTESTADLFKQYVDVIGFANFKAYPTDDPRRAYGDGTRVLYTERRPAFDAGNRLSLPPELPFDWDSFNGEASPRKGEAEATIKKVIEEMLPKIKDEKVRKAAQEAYPKKKSLGELNTFKTKMEAYI
jgi:hypothetical protein